jgi:DNA invertase Pin-like site-specific DNA recombinase
MALTAQREEQPWAIYARLSTAQDGGLAKCEYQVKVCEEYAAGLGIPTDPALVFIDDALSAWKKGVMRPGWDQLMAIAERGEIPGILLWESSRFTRRLKDAEALIDLAENSGLTVAGPGGRFDLTTKEGRRDLRTAATQAEYESDVISARAKDGFRRMARAGKPVGGAARVFGFEADGVTQRPDEAKVIRETADRMLRGEPVTTIAADLTERGVKTTLGNDFTVVTLRQVMMRTRNGGHIEHLGKVVGTIEGEPILDAETYAAVRSVFASRRRGRPNSGRYLLTGIATCGRCGKKLSGQTIREPNDKYVRLYKCTKKGGGCSLSVRAEPVDDRVGEEMTALLSDRKTMTRVAAEEAKLSDERAQRLAKVSAIEKQLVSLEVKWANGELLDEAYEEAKAVLDRRRAAASSTVDGLGVAGAPFAFTAAQRWGEMTTAEKRVAIEHLHLGVTIEPGKGGCRFDPKRVVITRPRQRSRQ